MCRMVQTDFFISHLKPRIKQIIHCCKICTILKKIMLSNNVPTASRRMEFFFTISYHRYRFCRAFRTKGLVTPDICLHKGLYVCIHLLCNQSNTSGSMFRFVNTCVPSSICSFRGEAWASTKIVSDNGRNSVGARRIMLREFSEFIRSASNDVFQKYALHGFEWNFIPPCPSYGGVVGSSCEKL